ncbi:MAG: hypothetical protein M3Q98_01075 [Actinomycetota bacterium]|nr:hypothetical protein [Actinomycetota bacterium]
MSGQVFHGWPEVPLRGSVVTMGVFDGFHRGHVALVDAARERGRCRGLPTVLVTFSPHPLTVLAPKRAPRQLLSIEDRVELALALGVDAVVVLPFDAELAAVPAQDFVSDGLVGHLGVRDLVVGDNFRCGRGGEGDVAFLRRIGETQNFGVHAVGLVREGDTACSSTEVRRCLDHGDLASAERLLGRRDSRILAAAG